MRDSFINLLSWLRLFGGDRGGSLAPLLFSAAPAKVGYHGWRRVCCFQLRLGQEDLDPKGHSDVSFFQHSASIFHSGGWAMLLALCFIAGLLCGYALCVATEKFFHGSDFVSLSISAPSRSTAEILPFAMDENRVIEITKARSKAAGHSA